MADLAYVADQIEQGRHLVPEHMWDAVKGYYLHGYQPGSFLTALLSNDLMGALGRGDAVNVRSMREWGQFLYNYTPGGSYGSPERVAAWLAAFDQREAA